MSALAEQEEGIDAKVKRLQEERDAGVRQLLGDARACYSAVEKWGHIHTPEEWQETVTTAHERYGAGRFLIERLGAERYMDPDLLATIWQLRQRLAEQTGGTVAELLLVDTAILAYYHTIRVNGWIGNLAVSIEHEFFGQAGPQAKLKQQYGSQVDGLQVEALLTRMGEQLLPLLERANRMMLRNLAALRDYRKVPAVSIASAGQVNVGERQVNVAGTVAPGNGNG